MQPLRFPVTRPSLRPGFLWKRRPEHENGTKMHHTVGVGPVLSYVTKVWRKDLTAELKWLPEMDVNNSLEGDYILFKLGMVF